MSITEIPSYFSDATGINETTIQIILSLVIIFMILLPYIILSKGKPNGFVTILLIFIGESISLGLGWSPFWLMIMFLVILVAAFAILTTKGVTGG